MCVNFFDDFAVLFCQGYVSSGSHSKSEQPRSGIFVHGTPFIPFPPRSFDHRHHQVLANVTVASGAMGVGALGLPLDLSNLVGGLMVLMFALFGRFLLNGDRIPSGNNNNKK